MITQKDLRLGNSPLIKKRKNINNKYSEFLMEIMHYEDIEVGQKRIKSLSYQVKKEEIIKFARHWDPRSFHIDEVAAVSSVFGGLVACSAHIFLCLNHW